MKQRMVLEGAALGLLTGMVIQYVALQLTIWLRIPDPLLAYFYSSLGVVAVFIAASFLRYYSREDLGTALGLLVSIFAWWLFLGIIMTFTGAYF